MDVQSTWQGLKQAMMFVLGGLIVLFAVVNSESVAVNLLFAQIELSLSLLILLSAVAGAAFGWLATAIRGRRRRRALEAGYQAELSAATEEEEDWMAEQQTSEGAPQSRH